MSRILLVDDDDPFRHMLAITLTKMGHEVMEARDGREGLQLSAAEPPDIVITDLIMPEKEGLETIGTLRRTQPEVKIIAMSGGSRDTGIDYLSVAKRLGAMRTLEKPFLPEELAEAIQAVTSGG